MSDDKSRSPAMARPRRSASAAHGAIPLAIVGEAIDLPAAATPAPTSRPPGIAGSGGLPTAAPRPPPSGAIGAPPSERPADVLGLRPLIQEEP
ncbi:hypothetical protein BE08_16310 [Sorangium cellulosum]|uniref:Uncharacterized protein n=1 Tax=Sorangium cellulosum TaxID=56 RepID=A0A150PLL8_SORCE|nr:hypothetical protein BE08_16310 [Sorangium cellulosum]